MKLSSKFIIGSLLIGSVAAYSLVSTDRRNFLAKAAAASTGTTAAALILPPPAIAADDEYQDFVTNESGLRYKVTKEGTGAIPEAGQTIKVHYTGWLDDFDSIKKFDSSRDRGRPFSFRVGAGQVIRGWDEGENVSAVVS